MVHCTALFTTFLLLSTHLLAPSQSGVKTRKHATTTRVLPYTPDPVLAIPRNTTRRLIILLTSFRGGSTFLGKLFDENPAVQYFFEPFHFAHMGWMYRNDKLEGVAPRHTLDEYRMLYLQQMLLCKEMRTSFAPYTEKWRTCGAAQENLQRFGTEECPKNVVRLEGLKEICNLRNTTAIKVISMNRLQDLLLVQNIRNADIRIVNFVRHPVPIMRSRNLWGYFAHTGKILKVDTGWYTRDERNILVAWEAHVYCADVMATLRLVSRDPWLRDRYLSVTHRQLSLEPVRTARSIYEHVGLEISAELEQFVWNQTLGLSHDREGHADVVSTSKNSKSVVFDWKKMDKLTDPLSNIRDIESVCSRLLKSFDKEFSFDPPTLKKLRNIYFPQ